jgi:hypothetical protein
VSSLFRRQQSIRETGDGERSQDTTQRSRPATIPGPYNMKDYIYPPYYIVQYIMRFIFPVTNSKELSIIRSYQRVYVILVSIL